MSNPHRTHEPQGEEQDTSLPTEGSGTRLNPRSGHVGLHRKLRGKSITLPQRFSPRFWEDADNRCALVREIKRRVERLREDTGADSYQKDLLCQRAVFVTLQLETLERAAAEGEASLDPGVYTQMVNALMGLLKALGLERKVKAAGLKSYMGRTA